MNDKTLELCKLTVKCCYAMRQPQVCSHDPTKFFKIHTSGKELHASDFMQTRFEASA